MINNGINKFTRRDFIKLMGVGVGTLTLNACGVIPPSSTRPTIAPNGAEPGPVSLAVDLVAGKSTAPILSGKETAVAQYQVSVREGSAELLQTLDGSTLGPIFRVQTGQRIQVQLQNQLDDATIIHWHGLRLSEEMDGLPQYVIEPGKNYDYDFQVLNRAGMYWFHPHTHGMTGTQVQQGLAGLFIVSDEEEAALGLPEGEYDLPLIIQDRTFDSDNQIVYEPDDMANQMVGFLGDMIMVNGVPNANMDVKSSVYRLRLLNASNSRIYKLAWQDNTPLTVIATDGGLLETPVTREYVTISSGERVELWVDFGALPAGSEMRLVSLPFSGFSAEELMMENSNLSLGASFDVLTFKIGEKGDSASALPQRLSTFERYQAEDAVNRDNPRVFTLAMKGMVHSINERTFDMDEVAEDEIVRLGDLEIWEFVNLEVGGGMQMEGMMMMPDMQMPHPMHIHGVSFQVLKREIMPEFESTYKDLSGGFVDEGWKDTVLVMPGEKVQVLVRFEDYAGTFVQHCHNLEHSDTGMMRNYRIEEA